MAVPHGAAYAIPGAPHEQFCAELIPLLGLVSAQGIGVVEAFVPFAPFLSEMVTLSASEARARYPDPTLYEFSDGAPAHLLAACVRHHDARVRDLPDAPTLLMVHPFAPYLRRWDASGDVMPYGSSDASGAARVLDALASAKEAGCATVLVEDPVSYALASARLVETGRVDRVFFSKHRWGEALDPSAYRKLPARQIAVGGAYTQTCVRVALGEACASPASEIALLEELCVTWPYERGNPRGEAFMCASTHGRRVQPVPAGRATGYLREMCSALRARS